MKYNIYTKYHGIPHGTLMNGNVKNGFLFTIDEKLIEIWHIKEGTFTKKHPVFVYHSMQKLM